MQGLKHTVAVFCIGCIAAELLAQLVGEDWPRRCIKSLAGLYILVALARGLSLTPVEWEGLPAVQGQPVELGSGEQAVLELAQQQLAQQLAADCARETGVQLRLRVTLAQTGEGTAPVGLQAAVEGETSPEDRRRAEQFLQQALGLPPVWVEDDGL